MDPSFRSNHKLSSEIKNNPPGFSEKKAGLKASEVCHASSGLATEQPTLYRLLSVQKSKFNKKERTYFLKQAQSLMEIDQKIKGVGILHKMYMSKNNNFFIYP